MTRSKNLQRVVHLSLAAAALAGAVPVFAQSTDTDKSSATLGAVIVTAQKREESIQDVPIAVTALSAEDLTARGLDGGRDVLQAVPNVTFSKTNFTSFNLQIRGVGTKLVGGSGDQGVAIHMNNVPLVASRFFEAEFYDIDRIEVLRGPQGTLYGRNATGGVFNAIVAKPSEKYESSLSLERGNYDSYRFKAMANAPFGDMVQARAALSYVKRDGFMTDPVHNKKIDGRDIISGRTSLTFKPTESFALNLMWEHFEETDDRQRAGKQLCAKDLGPATLAGGAFGPQSTTTVTGGQTPRNYLTQGCLPVSIYSPQSYSAINTGASLGGMLANIIGLQSGDANAGKVISTDLRVNDSPILPIYRAKSDIAVMDMQFKLSDELTLSSLTSYQSDRIKSIEDYNRAQPTQNFNTTFFTPGGLLSDPQIDQYTGGPTNKLTAYDISYADSQTWTEELRLQSAFSGPLNFNAGVNYLHLMSPVNGGYYVIFNTGTAYARCANIPANLGGCGGGQGPGGPVYIDPNPNPNEQGHNYYLNLQSYDLKSTAAFGEVYYQLTDTVKLTAGARYTSDKKEAISNPISLLSPGQGWTWTDASNVVHSPTPQSNSWKVLTYRGGIDWKLSDTSMLYAFYSRGYKAGGFNPGTQGNVKNTFDPEYVNSLEIGSKNTFADGRVQLNATLFGYKYNGYQISRIVQKTSVNDNVDADIYGAELEMAWQPLRHTRVDANIGYLKTKITEGTSVDTLNRTQGNTALTVMKASDGSNCAVPTAALSTLLGFINTQTAIPGSGGYVPSVTDLLGACSGSWTALGITPSDGVAVNLDGKELPNSPHITASIGAQQSVDLGSRWSATLRADFYHQTESFARMYNTDYDRLKGWSNLNVSLSFQNSQDLWNVLFYVKNALDKDTITDTYLTDDSSGLFTNVFVSEPRLYGLSISKKFQ